MKRVARHKKFAQVARRHRHARGGKRLIRVSFTTITPGEGEDYIAAGDYGEEHGWVDEEGSEISLDRYDRAEEKRSLRRLLSF